MCFPRNYGEVCEARKEERWGNDIKAPLRRLSIYHNGKGRAGEREEYLQRDERKTGKIFCPH